MAPSYKSKDDYKMLEHVLRRRFQALKDCEQKKNRSSRGSLEEKPDLLIIDGGKGHLNRALAVLKEFSLSIPVIAIAKGPGRKDGLETVYNQDGRVLEFEENDPVFHHLQKLRDEAHRFAITSHRQKNRKGSLQSELEAIPGIGQQRRKALLNHFGSLENIKKSGIKELSMTPGISYDTAKAIYGFFRGEK
jgi:excinuclease ABC subunit C